MKLLDFILKSIVTFLGLSDTEKRKIIELFLLGVCLPLITIWYVIPKCMKIMRTTEHKIYYQVVIGVTCLTAINWIVIIIVLGLELRPYI